ncbi:MAG: histidine kinase dimerization/phosphoacceptor domain -containing protein, partial [Pseudomonadota bacterium]
MARLFVSQFRPALALGIATGIMLILNIAVLVNAAFQSRARAFSKAETETVDAGRLVQQQLKLIFDVAEASLALEARAVEEQFKDNVSGHPGLRERFRVLKEANPYMSRMGSFDGSGKLIATTLNELPPGYNVKERIEFKRHSLGELGPILTTGGTSAVSKETNILMSRRLNLPNGDFGGDIKIGFNPSALRAFLQSVVPKNLIENVELVDDTGLVVVDGGSDIAKNNTVIVLPDLANAPDYNKAAFDQLHEGGAENIWVYYKVGWLPLYLRIGIGRSDVLAYWREDFFAYSVGAAGAGLAVLFLGGLSVIYARREEQHIEDLEATNTQLEKRVEERVAQLNDSNQRLELALQERTMLLREIHHRIKNNLQVVSSMVRLSARGHREEAVQTVLEEIARRIRAISLVHQTLHEHTFSETVDLKAFFEVLVASEADIYGAEQRQIQLTLDVNGKLQLDAAVSVGLVVSEAIANSFK